MPKGKRLLVSQTEMSDTTMKADHHLANPCLRVQGLALPGINPPVLVLPNLAPLHTLDHSFVQEAHPYRMRNLKSMLSFPHILTVSWSSFGGQYSVTSVFDSICFSVRLANFHLFRSDLPRCRCTYLSLIRSSLHTWQGSLSRAACDLITPKYVAQKAISFHGCLQKTMPSA